MITTPLSFFPSSMGEGHGGEVIEEYFLDIIQHVISIDFLNKGP
jgi:hypothetical protein